MTEQAPKNSQPTTEKLLIDDLSNFPFHAAYIVYAEVFDSASSDEERLELNKNIADLKNNVITSETFYRNISRYRKDFVPPPRYDRFTVQTQRKRDWRMKSQRQDRIRRHKK
ncbi:MAG: hypothetical protein N3D85_05945 [Candidatus Bathyarchaeota archaeon]|nr:hypothetical protein [Candidatus Bathyarchaeota archaeon]